MTKRKALTTSLDRNAMVRDALVARIVKSAKDTRVPVALLLSLVQTLEDFLEDA